MKQVPISLFKLDVKMVNGDMLDKFGDGLDLVDMHGGSTTFGFLNI